MDYTKRHLKRIIRSDLFQTIKTLQGQLRSMSKNGFCTTLKNWIKKLGFKYRSAASNPKLSDNKKNRFKWAIKHIGWTDKQWEQVFRSDESRFRLFGHNGKPKILRKQGKCYESCRPPRTVKYGVGSLTVWSCFWAGGYGPLIFVDDNMKQNSYTTPTINLTKR